MIARPRALHLVACVLPAPLAVVLLWLLTGRAPLADLGTTLPLALLSGCVAAALLLHEALCLGQARGPVRHAAAIEPFAERLASGHFDQVPEPSPALRHDDALQWLRAGLLEVHEERQRMRRLLSVLRAAETDPERRVAIEALRRAVDGDDHFAADTLAPMTLPPSDVTTPALVLLGLTAGAMLVGVAGWWWPGGWVAPALAAACAVVAAAGLRRAPAAARGLLAGALAALAWAWASGGMA